MGNCLTRFMALFDTVVNFLKENNTYLSVSLLQQKSSILYLENIFRTLNEQNYGVEIERDGRQLLSFSQFE